MISIGITGIIGSGKSMLSQVFRSMSIPVYDADKNAQIMMNSDKRIIESLTENFGKETYKNGSINKDFLRNIVFNNEDKRLKINSIVHPIVIEDFVKWRENSDCEIIAIESAILFEAKIENVLDYIVFVEADRQTLIERICKRDNVSPEIAERKIDLQMRNSGKEKCNILITNDKNLSIIEQANLFIDSIKR